MLKNLLTSVDGLLIDIDGVLTRGTEVIPGAPETISALRARDIPFRFMTNTTIYSRPSLLERLMAMGFDVLSMNSSTLLKVKSVIRSLTLEAAQDLLDQVLQLEDSQMVRSAVDMALYNAGVDRLLRSSRINYLCLSAFICGLHMITHFGNRRSRLLRAMSAATSAGSWSSQWRVSAAISGRSAQRLGL